MIASISDVTLGAKAWWTVRPSECALSTLCSEVEYSNVLLPPDWNCCTGANAPSLHWKGGPQMLTIEGLIAVISLVLTAFGLGYAIGRNSKTQE